jgi:hypothetical protein
MTGTVEIGPIFLNPDVSVGASHRKPALAITAMKP